MIAGAEFDFFVERHAQPIAPTHPVPPERLERLALRRSARLLQPSVQPPEECALGHSPDQRLLRLPPTRLPMRFSVADLPLADLPLADLQVVHFEPASARHLN